MTEDRTTGLSCSGPKLRDRSNLRDRHENRFVERQDNLPGKGERGRGKKELKIGEEVGRSYLPGV